MLPLPPDPSRFRVYLSMGKSQVTNYKQSIYSFLNHTCVNCGKVGSVEELVIRDLGGCPRPQDEQYKGFLRKVYNSLIAQDGEQGGYRLWCRECVAGLPKVASLARPAGVRAMSAWERVARALGRMEVLVDRCDVVSTGELRELVGMLRSAIRREAPGLAEGQLPPGRSVSDEELARRLATLGEEEEGEV